VNRAIKLCHESIEACKKEDVKVRETPLNGFELAEIIPRFDKQSLVFSHDVLDYPYIETQIGLYIKDSLLGQFRNLIPIGTYRLITTLDGMVDDDYLEITETKADITNRNSI
jgi:hypothetical protein